MHRLREKEARVWALILASLQPNGRISTSTLKDLMPMYREMSTEDMALSPTRRGELRWMQIVGNVVCHKPGSTSIFTKGLAERTEDGFQITALGQTYVEKQKILPYARIKAGKPQTNSSTLPEQLKLWRT